MCTAVSYKAEEHYFGRTLDYEFSYGESVVITPREYPLIFQNGTRWNHHYAMIGMAHIAEGSPLYYEATNEKGLSAAGLNFPGFAAYHPEKDGMDNVAAFELIWWLLGQFATVEELRPALKRLNITAWDFREDMSATPLHWLVADENHSIVLESMADGLHVHENPVGVLTNSPPFDFHMLNLTRHMGMGQKPVENRLCSHVELGAFSRGMGAFGLPGDLSSPGRFVRCAFHKLNSSAKGNEVSQFFHILGSVEHTRGSVLLEDGQYEITIYTCCCNTSRGIYYYTTYDNGRITAVDMHRESLDQSELITYPLLTKQDIYLQN